jgi:hypothetical protein
MLWQWPPLKVSAVHILVSRKADVVDRVVPFRCDAPRPHRQSIVRCHTDALHRDSTGTTPAGVGHRKFYGEGTGTTPTGVCRCDRPVYTPPPDLRLSEAHHVGHCNNTTVVLDGESP